MIYISRTEPEADEDYFAEIDVLPKEASNFYNQIKYMPGEAKIKFFIENFDKIQESDLRKIVDAR